MRGLDWLRSLSAGAQRRSDSRGRPRLVPIPVSQYICYRTLQFTDFKDSFLGLSPLRGSSKKSGVSARTGNGAASNNVSLRRPSLLSSTNRVPLPCSLTGLVEPHHLDIRRKMADQRMKHPKEEKACLPRSKRLTDSLSNVTIPFIENTLAEVALDRPPGSRPARVC